MAVTNPIRITASSPSPVHTELINIKKIVWYEPETTAHELKITDINGNIIWHKHSLAVGSGIDYTIDLDGWYNGIIVATLSSGVVYIHVFQHY